MKTLCVYSTRTRITEAVARKIADAAGAELLYITDGKDRSGFFGYIAAAISGLKKDLPELLPYKTEFPIEEYDRIIFASPIWCEDISPIIRAFLKQNADKLKGEIFAAVTHMSNIDYAQKIKKAFGEAVKYVSVKTHKNDFTAQIEEFCNKYFN
ncbi:MAG: hypothetical protein KBS52_01100 [Clostridiales bacterium]|nr:hypothetical protein [Candidatus Equinaster intestinalis]